MLPMPFQSNHRPLQFSRGPRIQVKNPYSKMRDILFVDKTSETLLKRGIPFLWPTPFFSLSILLPNPSGFSSSSPVFSISQLFTFLTSQNTECQNDNHKPYKVILLLRVPSVTANC